ncbi:hypothetical protein CRUP_016864, partial [Coryphaenoides rupestris]
RRRSLSFTPISAGSFNAAAKDAAVEVLTAQGCSVEVSNLYGLKLAWEEGKQSEDIMEEQRKLTQADSSLKCFPMYWFSVLGVLTGWIDRVLEKRYSQGIFKDKKAMLSFTTGSNESMFSTNGINGDMNVTLWPMPNGILHYCGFQVLAPQIFWSHVEARAAMRRTLSNSFNGDKGFQLKPEVQEKHKGQEFGLMVGTHLGKRLPPNSQIRAGV